MSEISAVRRSRTYLAYAYNLFDIYGSHLISMDELLAESKAMQYQRTNTVFVLIGNDEIRTTQAWKILRAESVPNLYLIEGGINHWLRIYAYSEFRFRNVLLHNNDD